MPGEIERLAAGMEALYADVRSRRNHQAQTNTTTVVRSGLLCRMYVEAIFCHDRSELAEGFQSVGEVEG